MKVEELATEQNVPPNYLVQILLELKSKLIVKSVRGKEGGYLLARAPGEITLGEVLRAMHGQVFDSPALSDAECPPELRAAWKKLQARRWLLGAGVPLNEAHRRCPIRPG